MKNFDIIVVGAGIVGAATALELANTYPTMRILLVEKERQSALHQTGRNSGVIHAGVYYPPGSLKAEFCKQGLAQTIAFCNTYHLPFEQCGKLLVATNSLEVSRMDALFQRCQQNGLSPVYLSKSDLAVKEPNVQGEGAIWVEQTGITDYTKITETLLALFKQRGGNIAFAHEVSGIEETEQHIFVQCETQRFKANFLVSCAGLMSDKLIKLQGIKTDFSIVPFKGEYFRLSSHLNNLVNHLIYPIPDPNLPFLGVHLTKMIDGSITVGPSAVLAFKREGYNKFEWDLSSLWELGTNTGLRRLMKQYYKSGIEEMKHSLFKSSYLNLVNKYCPHIKKHDLHPYPSGIRAQAVRDSGELIHDFEFVQTSRSLHVGNAPSPAATSAFPIAKSIVERIPNF